MPRSEYFKGHGEEVMKGMKKKYGKRAEEVFHRTAKAKHMEPESKMPKGASMSPKGDIGEYRQMEGAKAGGAELFKGSPVVKASSALPWRGHK